MQQHSSKVWLNETIDKIKKFGWHGLHSCQQFVCLLQVRIMFISFFQTLDWNSVWVLTSFYCYWPFKSHLFLEFHQVPLGHGHFEVTPDTQYYGRKSWEWTHKNFWWLWQLFRLSSSLSSNTFSFWKFDWLNRKSKDIKRIKIFFSKIMICLGLTPSKESKVKMFDCS